MKRAINEYECEECDGKGQVECPCCYSDTDCEACNGSGYNDRLDVKRFEEALRAAVGRWRGGCLFIENGVAFGYMKATFRDETDNGERVLFKDYEKQPAMEGDGR
jgi:hypothetical protein